MSRSDFLYPYLCVSPHPSFARTNEDRRCIEQAQAAVEQADNRTMQGKRGLKPRWIAAHQQLMGGILATSTVLATLVAVIVTAGPIQTLGPAGSQMQRHDTKPPTPHYATVANAAGKISP